MSALIALSVGVVRRTEGRQSMLRWADQYRAAKEYSQAIDLYQQLMVMHPRWAVPHVDLGQVYLTQGRLEEADSEFSQARALDPGEEEALVGLGQVAYQRGEVEKAIDWWGQAVALSATNAEAHYRLGRAYLDQSRIELAELELEGVVALDREHQRAHYYLGLLLAAERATEAGEHFRIAAEGDDLELVRRAQEMVVVVDEIASSQDEAYAAARLGRAYLKCEVPGLALAQLKKAVALQPDNHAARSYLGYALIALGEHEKARTVLREVRYEAPKYPLAPYFLALSHLSEGYLPTALWELKQSLRLDPYNAATYASMGETYQRMGRYAVAGEWYAAAVEVAPDEADFSLLLAQFYVDVLPRPEEGLAAAKQAAFLLPDNPLAQDLLGWAYYLAGDLVQAEAALERAVSLDPDFARAYYHLGVVHEQAEDVERARWAYGRAIDVDGDGLYRERAVAALGE